MFRQNLYMFRCSKRLSQNGISEKIGCTRATYSNIEIGKRNGRASFWDKLQKAFDLTPSELEKLKQKAGAENDKGE